MSVANSGREDRAGAGSEWRRGLLPMPLLLASSLVAAQPYMISNVPLVVPSALEPNIILSLDDSPGMANAFPLGPNFSALASGNAVATNGSIAPANTRRYKSSTFNPLYYNPNVQYVVPDGAISANNSTAFDSALINGYYVGTGNASNWKVDLRTNFRPTLSLTITESGNSQNLTQSFADHAAADLGTGANQVGTTLATGGGAAYYYVYDTALAGCNADITNDACYRLQRVTTTSGPGGTDERQNFANWYSYYRTRHLAMISGAWRVTADPQLIGTRLAWQALNSCNSFANGNTCSGFSVSSNSVSNISNLINEFGWARRASLQDWLRRVRPTNATPSAPLRTALQRAGQYFSSSGSINNPYLLYPQSSASASNPEHACRPNFNLLIAGGSYDDSDAGSYCSGNACGNADGTSRTLPDGTAYSGAQRPYTDSNSNSLADVAFHYWATDLRSGLDNVLLPYIRDRSGGSAAAQYWNPRNDPARWQHMVNFTVGVGLQRTLDDPNIPWTGDSFGGTGYANLVSGAANWPATTAGSTGRMYDLWHAALNSRGEFFGADTPDQVVAAINAALARTIERADVGASLAANSTRLTTESRLYQASFDTRDWTGRLKAIGVNPDGSLSNVNDWDATAAGRIPAAEQRNILTSSGETTGIEFTWTALGNAGLQPAIGNEATLNYLRGDQSNEIANGGSFRNRSVRLGDIVNSEIAFAGVEDFGYDALVDLANLGSPASVAGLAYPPYLQTKSTRTKLVIVGANDGMLHGFDADTGAEKFAFVPRALLVDRISDADQRSNLVTLADPAYTHRYFVDGSPWIGDAYWSGAWHTVVVGTTGAGGKGAFALDITNPDAMTPGKVLWDIDGENDPNLGYTIGQAVIGRLHDGQFYALFGNGYKSANECPVLYIVRLSDGQVRKIPTGGRTLNATCNDQPNGLGRPSLFDLESPGAVGYRTTDYVYAGDMRGNLWRFDLRSVNLNAEPATSWGVQLMFSARNASGEIQPITGTIEIGAAPSGVGTPAAMLWFGTGRWFAVDDRVDTTGQTMYGIVDRFESGGNANSAKVVRNDLVGQSINTGGGSAGTITGSAVAYTANGNARRDGWYLDLPRSGERMVGLPLIQSGRLIFATIIPDEDKCAGGGTSSILAVDPYNGYGLAQRIFINHSGMDFIGSTVGIVRNLVYIGTGTRAFLYAGGSTASSATGSTIQFEEVRPVQQAGARGRVSWREIVK